MVECSFTNYVVTGSNPVAVTETSDIAFVSSKEFLVIQATTKCRFTLKRPRDMIRTHDESPCYLCYIFEYVYLPAFHVNFLLKRYLFRGQRISRSTHHLERADNKPVSGLIGPRPTSRKVVHESWAVRSPLVFCNLAKSFKHNTTYFTFFTFQKPSKEGGSFKKQVRLEREG